MNPNAPAESIAIIGMAGRFPRAATVAEFWRNLREGAEGISFFRPEEMQWLPIEHAPDLKDPRFVRARGLVDRPEWFDAAFFGVNPREADLMDPQHRVFLECAWEALEAAGCNPDTFGGLIGVFAGASLNTYLLSNLLTNGPLVANAGVFSALLGNAGDCLTTRVSYKLNLRGPSINVQTACSTSLVAVCLACQTLLTYRCDVALAGGITLQFPSRRGHHHQEGGIVSDDGHCRAFDARSTGTVFSDGAGVVALKRLGDALADGDYIHAIIRGSAMNNDGSAKIGYTAPSVGGQAECIAMALAEAEIAPETISYVETHGTGTPLGDPIEIAGLTQAFGIGGERRQTCAIGSVKSNIGHLDIAAGVAGLIKTVLALEHGEIPPSIHFDTPNPKIDFAHSPFFVAHTLQPWPRGASPRRAGVSSFGIGGTNAHVVLEEAPAAEPSSPPAPGQLLLLSAKTATALETATDNLVAHLGAQPALNLADVAFTLQVGRKVFPHRRLVVANDVADAVKVLQAREPRRVITGATEADAPSIAFLFPGQGAQAVNMARSWYETEPAFRAEVDRGCASLKPRLGLDLRDILFPPSERTEAAAKQLTETRLTQPALFVIEHALAQCWMRWGVKPVAMIGHSLGEYVAACLAGVFTLEDALALVAERARLMQAQPPGAMLAVRLPEAKIGEYLASNLALAAVNAPGLSVVSGPFDAMDALERRLSAGAIAFKRLATSHAFHSPMMEPVLRPLAGFIRQLKPGAPKLPIISNVTGTWLSAAQATDPEYWVTHLRRTVRFADGVGELAKSGARVLLEVGPGATLAGLARQHPAAANGAVTVLASLGRAREGVGDRAAMLHTLGELWLAGARIDWRGGVHRDDRRHLVPLPTYPFERKRHWVEPGTGVALTTSPAAAAPGTARQADTMPAVNSAGRNGEPTRPPGAPAPVVASPAAADTTLATLKRIFQELSGIDLAAASADESFYQLGFDSLFLTQASLAVGRRFGLDITFRQLREDLITLGRLTAYIDERMKPVAVVPPAAGLPGHLTVAAAAAASPGGAPVNGEALAVNGRSAATESGRVGRRGRSLVEHRIPLTDAQREIWYACQFGPGASAAYNETITLRLDGPLNVGALRRALELLVARHEALRARFSPAGDVQHIAANLHLEFASHDFAGADPTCRHELAMECAGEQVNATFDLVNGPLIRVALIRIEPESHLLVLTVHHLVCDGWSLAVLQHELGELYSADVLGRPAVLPEAPRFSDYAGAQSDVRSTPEFVAAEEFWQRDFAGEVPVLELPTDRPRPAQRTYAGGFFLQTLTPDVTAGVRRLCGEQGCTMFTALLGAFNVLLHRLSAQDDVIVGVPAAAQVMAGLGHAVGHFANLLPIRSRVQPDQSFRAYLAEVRSHMNRALEHWRYPFGTLLQQLDFVREPGRVPLAPVVFNTVRHRGGIGFARLAVTPTRNPKRFVNFDLNFNFAVADDGITLGCYYSRELYDEATLARWLGHFETLLRGIVAQPETPVAELPLLTAAERQRMLVEWNDTALAYERDATIPELFAAQVRRTPDAVAIVGEQERVTYAELDEQSDALAARLRAAGVGPDAMVGLFLSRTPRLLAGIFGVLKAGGGYVPLDPAYPADRLGFIVEDTRMNVLVSERALLDRLPAGNRRVIVIDDEGDAGGPTTAAVASGRITPESLAYVIYTSGSSGRPKGVQITHRCVVALVAWARQLYRPDELAGVFFSTSATFDISIFEIFCPLCIGGKLILAENILQLGTHPAREEVTFLSGVPSAMAEVVRSQLIPGSARTVALAGEQFPQPLVDALYALPHIERVFELYGPTETTVYSTGSLRRAHDRPSLGRPFPNERVYVLDRRLQPVPIGVAGELFIAGDKLARGYLNRPELTAERFLMAPFRPGERIYQTGDGARVLADGTLEFAGRLDHQVKIRGFRVELGEVEAALARHPTVGESVVITRPDPSGGNRLLAYVVAAPDAAPQAATLRGHLQRQLPEYMVPAAITVLERFPLTANGKLDRRALPEPDFGRTEAALAPPRNLTEELLADIWREVLGLERLGIHDNFFELGGHSLLAAQVIARVHGVLNVELTLPQVFASPTIAGIAPVIEVALLEQINAEPVDLSARNSRAETTTAKD